MACERGIVVKTTAAFAPKFMPPPGEVSKTLNPHDMMKPFSAIALFPLKSHYHRALYMTREKSYPEFMC
jgi:hypothetical protein